MEEVLPDKGRSKSSATSQQPATNGDKIKNLRDMPIDLSRVDVRVDASGKIIPLLNRGASGSVQNFFSRTAVGNEVPVPYYVGPNPGVAWTPAGQSFYPGQYWLPYTSPYSYNPYARGFGTSVPLGRLGRFNLGWNPSAGLGTSLTPRYATNNTWSPAWNSYPPGWNTNSPAWNSYPPTSNIYSPWPSTGTPGTWAPGANSWGVPSSPFTLPPPAWRYITPQGVTPWYTPLGAGPMPGTFPDVLGY